MAATAIAATSHSCLVCLVLLPAPVHVLDPNKRINQYIHTAWRTQDGSLPSGMFSITQTSDDFLWFLSLPGDVYRFDGVRFLPWHFPTASNRPIAKLLADRAVGLWLAEEELVYLKDGVATSHFVSVVRWWTTAVLSSHALEGHYGLRRMRERATLIRGNLALWSEVDEGTEVELRVPASATPRQLEGVPGRCEKLAGKTRA